VRHERLDVAHPQKSLPLLVHPLNPP